MGKTSKGLTAVAVAVLGSQALAAVPGTSPLANEGSTPAISIGTGLTTSDLFVGLDGTVAFDAKAHGLQVAACANGAQENVNCSNVCCQ